MEKWDKYLRIVEGVSLKRGFEVKNRRRPVVEVVESIDNWCLGNQRLFIFLVVKTCVNRWRSKISYINIKNQFYFFIFFYEKLIENMRRPTKKKCASRSCTWWTIHVCRLDWNIGRVCYWTPLPVSFVIHSEYLFTFSKPSYVGYRPSCSHLNVLKENRLGNIGTPLQIAKYAQQDTMTQNNVTTICAMGRINSLAATSRFRAR